MSTNRELVFDVTGMTCSECESHVVSALAAVPGVTGAEASYPDGEARIAADASADPSDIERALTGAGYPGTLRESPVAVTHRSDKSGGYDLVIVGGGSAGFSAALRADELGARVAIVNAGTLGGTCVNVGCVPSKTLIRAAQAQHGRSHHPFDGIPTTNGAPDWVAVRSQKDELVSRLRTAKYRDVLAGHDAIDLYETRATVSGNGTISLGDGGKISGRRLLITTGSSPWAPDIPGLAGTGFLDSTSAMDLDTLPDSLVVLGAGFVGMELGQTFSRLGVNVTIISRRSTVLPHDDPAIGPALAEYVRTEGIDVVTNASVTGVDRGDAFAVHYEVEGKATSVVAEQLLVATGRRANTAGFGLEESGVGLGGRGEILVDEHLQTSNPNIYAAGDVTGDPMFVYVAAYAGSVATDNALGHNQRPYDLTAVPSVTFTDPAAASVGFTESKARARGFDPIVSTLPLEHLPRALAARDTRGFVKLIADRASRRILGAHILAADAGEMIMEPAMAIKFGLTIDDITAMFHPYLTLSEGIKLAAQTFDKDVAQLSCCAA